MKVEHMIWNDYDRTDYADYSVTVVGILELEIVWHGGGSAICIIEGTYDDKNRCFSNSELGIKIDSNTLGVAGVSLRRVGQLVD